MSVGDVLVRPVDISVAVGRRIPRHMVVIREVLRDVQFRATRVAASIEYATVLVGSKWLVITTCAAHVQVRFLEVLCTMRVERVTLVRHLAIAIHDVVSVAGSVRLTESTEVDVGVAVGIPRYPEVIEVLVWHPGLSSD